MCPLPPSLCLSDDLQTLRKIKSAILLFDPSVIKMKPIFPPTVWTEHLLDMATVLKGELYFILEGQQYKNSPCLPPHLLLPPMVS